MENGLSQAYINRCHRKLEALGAPLSGWYCVGVTDEETDSFTCELCGCPKVRYVHEMSHPQFPINIRVGCICAGIMEGDISAAEERDRLMKNRSRRRITFIENGWCVNRNGVYRKNYRDITCRIMKSKYHSDSYGVWKGNHWCWRYRGEPISSFEKAAAILFNAIDKPIEDGRRLRVSNARENH